MTAGSVRKASTRLGPPQWLQTSTSTEKTRRMSSAHEYRLRRVGCPAGSVSAASPSPVRSAQTGSGVSSSGGGGTTRLRRDEAGAKTPW